MQRLAALLLLLCSSVAWADEASHRALAEELIGLTHADDSVLAWRKRFDAQAQEMVKATTDGRTETALTDAQKLAVERFSQRGGAVLDEALAADRVHEPLVRMYMQTFTEDESREIAVFLKTAAGQKLLGNLPALSDGVAGVVRTQVDAIRPRLNSIAQDFQTEYTQASPHAARTVRVNPPVPPGGMGDAVPAALDAPAAQAAVVKSRSSARSKSTAHGKKRSGAAHVARPATGKAAAAKPATGKTKARTPRCKDSSRSYPHCSK